MASSTARPPSSYHLSHRVCLDTEELARRSAIYASLADSMVASVIEELSPKDERSPREVGHHPRGSGFCGVCGFCSGVQPAVVTPWCPSQELQFPAPSSLCSAYSAVWRSPCGWSWTKGTSSAGPGHQTSWSYDRLISDFSLSERSQDQHEDVIQEDGS